MGAYRLARLRGNSDVRRRVNEQLAETWGDVTVAVHGERFDLSACEGFTCQQGGNLLGALHYRLTGNECEVLSLYALREHAGVGQALMRQAAREARTRGAKRLVLVTTNDNARTIRFYQQFGMELEAIDRYAVQRARELKPSIPLTGCDGIPILHELRFGMAL
jgi:ribosomal protein S18 acetylase RimI-like enzyme